MCKGPGRLGETADVLAPASWTGPNPSVRRQTSSYTSRYSVNTEYLLGVHTFSHTYFRTYVYGKLRSQSYIFLVPIVLRRAVGRAMRVTR